MGAKARWIALLLLWPTVAQAAGLTAWPSLSAPVRNTIPASLMVIKGQSTNSLYAMEVDQTTGALPVEGVGGTPIAVVATQGTTPWIVAGGGTAGTPGTAVLAIQGVASGTAVPVSGTFFQATQPISGTVTANAGTGNFNVVGTGTAGTPSSGILTIQGNASGTPIPISGSITASNASIGATGAAVPASATYIGGINGGNLVGLAADSSSRLVTVGAGTAGSAAGGVFTVQGSASGTAVPVSGTVTANAGSGTFTVSGTVTANAGTGTFTTDQTTAAGTFQDGAIAFGSLTTSYQTVVTTGGVAKVVSMRNNTNAIILVSLNAGSTTSYTLDPSDAVSLDLKQAGLSIASSTALQAKYSGSAPTTGNIRLNVAY